MSDDAGLAPNTYTPIETRTPLGNLASRDNIVGDGPGTAEDDLVGAEDDE